MIQIDARPYQRKAVDTVLKAYRTTEGTRSGIHIQATGLGKTVVSVLTTAEGFHPNTGKRSIFAGGINQELVFQGFEAYTHFMPELKKTVFHKGDYRRGAGIVMGNLSHDEAGLIVASMPTLVEKTPSTGVQVDENGLTILPEDEPIETKDIVRDSKGNIFLNPNSKRRFLVSPRFDKILSYGLIDCFIYDEAHHAVSNGALSMFKRIDSLHRALDEPLMFNIGNTATPNRPDEIGLNNLYQTIFSNYNIFWGISHGYLAPLLQPIRMTIGEMEEEDESGDILTTEGGALKSVENWADLMVQGWKDVANGRPTFVYIGKMNDMSAIEASKYLTFKFNQAGIPAAHLDYMGCIGPDGKQYPPEYRKVILSMYKQGLIKVLCNFGVLIEGIDAPLTSCVMIARKVNELTFTQIIGRGLRLFNGDTKLGLPPKDGLLLIDVTGQALTVDTMASIIGYTVDPTDRQKIILDPQMIEDLMEQVQDIWYNANLQERIREWAKIQTKYQDNTLERSLSKAVLMQVEKATTTDCAIYRMVIDIAYSEDDILNAMDMQGVEEITTKKGKTTRFDEFEIARASKNDWEFDEIDGTAALQVGENDALVILSPNYAVQNRIIKMKHMVEARLTSPETEVTHMLINKADESLLLQLMDALDAYLTLFSEYTVWHVDTSNIYKSRLVIPANAPTDSNGKVQPWFVISERDSYEASIAASKYAYTHCEITDAFIKKNAPWKKKKEYGQPAPVTSGQIYALRELGYMEDPRTLTKTQASSKITHIAASPLVQRIRDDRIREVAKLWNLKKSK